MSDDGTINVSRSVIDDSWSINYKNKIIIRMMPQLGALLTDNSRSIIYDRKLFYVYKVPDMNWLVQGVQPY